ncbi:hypothetical protein [Flammeovirga aprica]|uniref:Uncharacterized protein n=1 Tax=Flammeovirga aprica JL-4 TaxID=694437 RepID=A0A7X9XC91_9BACT|nr:hypothetical protein [Flammeovirga aprica]NME71546.1 hypothetical protein [Flammeovirga aprica JL-4]
MTDGSEFSVDFVLSLILKQNTNRQFVVELKNKTDVFLDLEVKDDKDNELLKLDDVSFDGNFTLLEGTFDSLAHFLAHYIFLTNAYKYYIYKQTKDRLSAIKDIANSFLDWFDLDLIFDSGIEAIPKEIRDQFWKTENAYWDLLHKPYYRNVRMGGSVNDGETTTYTQKVALPYQKVNNKEGQSTTDKLLGLKSLKEIIDWQTGGKKVERTVVPQESEATLIENNLLQFIIDLIIEGSYNILFGLESLKFLWKYDYDDLNEKIKKEPLINLMHENYQIVCETLMLLAQQLKKTNKIGKKIYGAEQWIKKKKEKITESPLVKKVEKIFTSAYSLNMNYQVGQFEDDYRMEHSEDDPEKYELKKSNRLNIEMNIPMGIYLGSDFINKVLESNALEGDNKINALKAVFNDYDWEAGEADFSQSLNEVTYKWLYKIFDDTSKLKADGLTKELKELEQLKDYTAVALTSSSNGITHLTSLIPILDLDASCRFSSEWTFENYEWKLSHSCWSLFGAAGVSTSLLAGFKKLKGNKKTKGADNKSGNKTTSKNNSNKTSSENQDQKMLVSVFDMLNSQQVSATINAGFTRNETFVTYFDGQPSYNIYKIANVYFSHQNNKDGAEEVEVIASEFYPIINDLEKSKDTPSKRKDGFSKEYYEDEVVNFNSGSEQAYALYHTKEGRNQYFTSNGWNQFVKKHIKELVVVADAFAESLRGAVEKDGDSYIWNTSSLEIGGINPEMHFGKLDQILTSKNPNPMRVIFDKNAWPVLNDIVKIKFLTKYLLLPMYHDNNKNKYELYK